MGGIPNLYHLSLVDDLENSMYIYNIYADCVVSLYREKAYFLYTFDNLFCI